MHLFHNIVYLAGLNIPSKVEGIPNANVQAFIMKNLTEKSDGIFTAQLKSNSDIARLVDDNVNINNTSVFAKTQTLHQTLMQ